MQTKAFFKLKQRVVSYSTDMELCELLVGQFMGMPDFKETIVGSLGAAPNDFPNLGRLRNLPQSRKAHGNHLVRTLRIAFIKELYEDFEIYLATIMTNAASKGINPHRFVGEAKVVLKASEMLSAKGWDGVVRMVTDEIFRGLVNERNTRTLIKKVNNSLGLEIQETTLNSAMPYLDARHIFVHRDGTPDKEYREQYPEIAVKKKVIHIDSDFVADAREAIVELACEIDKQVIHADLVQIKDMHLEKASEDVS